MRGILPVVKACAETQLDYSNYAECSEINSLQLGYRIDVQVSINGLIASVKSELHYVSDKDENTETVFVFPLDSDAAVYEFEAEIDGKTIVAEVQEKSQAKETYQDAVASGYTAVYMSEADNAGDTFRLKLGNLPAKAAARLTLRYVQEVDVSSDKIGTFMLPRALNPRYVPNPSDASFRIHTIQSGVTYCPDFTMNLNAVIAGGTRMVDLTTKWEFDVLAEKMDEMISSSKQLDNGIDFSIVLHYKGFEQPGVVLETGSADKNNPFLSTDVLMVNFSPNFENLENQVPCEFVIIIDCSGSMMGSRMEKAKETLLLILKSLPVNCKFTIIRFGSRFSSLFLESSKYDENSLKVAMQLQKNLQADMGGTEILKPLENVFKNRLSGCHSRQIFLLTDGAVYNVPELVQLVRKQKNTRVFTFGMGDGCSTELIRDVAKAGNGKATFVKDSDRLQSKVMSVLKASIQSEITDVTLTWSLPTGCTAINVPENVPAIFDGEMFILYCIISGNVEESLFGKSSVVLTGHAGDKTLDYKMNFVLGSKKQTDADNLYPIHRLAAKASLTEMEISNVKESLMVSLSTTTNITCKYTAFVGVDKHSKGIVAKGIYLFDIQIQEFEGTKFLELQIRKLKTDTCLSSVMMQLIEIQAFDGSWQLTDNFSKILGNTMEQLRRESPVADIDIWATALAVAFLRKNFLEQREEWEMVEEKALKWLSTKTNDGKDVLQEASKILS
uniref:von Willebrand factor A domain-containing protein 5A n=1 Tax=Magallana gigas TaxID=29159 RepID=K1Q7V6_MAGGI